ncbi:hypothetical protein HZC20_03235 [Candidatus Peregrinibacteria bacterium]|nr:hypothetical protein [Candidatus Peregrinibacteria bacterium]
MHFNKPFEIAYEKTDTADIVVLGLYDTEGNFGLGSAAPAPEITGETVDADYDILHKNINPDFFNIPLNNANDLKLYHEKIEKIFHQMPSAQMAVESAILELFAKRNNISLTEFFGGYRTTCDIVMTICLKNMADTASEAKERIKQGYKKIKLKCGVDVDEDSARIKLVSELLPHDGCLTLDANQGYTFDEAARFLKNMESYPIKLIEQPTRENDFDALKLLKKTSKIPIIADESARNFEDAEKLINGDFIDGINIKLMKCGGPFNFIKIFNLIKSHGKTALIGCMYESQISMTMGAHLALGLPIDYVDLDTGRLDFADDPARGGVDIYDGKIQKIEPLTI